MLDISLENNIYVTNPIDQFFQEVDVLFNTKLTSLMDDIYFGMDFEQYLWSLKDNTDEITKYVKDTINNKCPSSQNITWSAGCLYLYDEAERPYYLVVILVMSPNGNVRNQSYIFHNYSEDTPIIKTNIEI